MVLMADMEALRDVYQAEGAVECAAGMQVLIDRGYAEQEHRASREAPLDQLEA